MQRRDFVISTLVSAPGLSLPVGVAAQKKAVVPDLAALAENRSLNISLLNEGARKGIRLTNGVAYLPGVEFGNGTIELELRGKDVQQQSFLGVAFHGVDDKTMDLIYFRPFNFKTDDSARRLRAVQYVSHPTYTWQKLRTEQPGKFEQPVNPVPDPNDWFRARVVIAHLQVSIFVNDAKEPCLVVTQLSDRKKGLVGLWNGSAAGGDFANLKIIPA
ncbi:MAG: hypothetical protein HOP19_23670 [Acidobacteria bacterium]|nr:hypothetical protein [Acidobacteriota bacterium]